MSLFWRVFVTNAALLVVAAIVLGVSPITVSWPIALTEAVVLTFGLVAMLVANALLLRPAFNPLLERLEAERRESGRRAVAAQEAERKRVASELHDEVGQAMTGVLMLLARLQDAVVPERRRELADAQEAIRGGLEEVRRIAQELRPELLEHLGLVSALRALARTFAARTGIEVECRFAPELLKLDRDVELALYRIVQESLTNVARHAGATRVELSMGPRQGGVGVRVVDDGRGVHGPLRDGGGVRGMRERAMVVGGELAITAARAGGVEVRVNVPALEER